MPDWHSFIDSGDSLTFVASSGADDGQYVEQPVTVSHSSFVSSLEYSLNHISGTFYQHMSPNNVDSHHLL